MIEIPIDELKEEHFYEDDSLTDNEVHLINKLAWEPEYNEIIRSILGYKVSRLKPFITRRVMDHLQELGIDEFGRTAASGKDRIAEFLEENPLLRDEEPERCINKIICYFWQKYQKRLTEKAARKRREVQKSNTINKKSKSETGGSLGSAKSVGRSKRPKKIHDPEIIVTEPQDVFEEEESI